MTARARKTALGMTIYLF